MTHSLSARQLKLPLIILTLTFLGVTILAALSFRNVKKPPASTVISKSTESIDSCPQTNLTRAEAFTLLNTAAYPEFGFEPSACFTPTSSCLSSAPVDRATILIAAMSFGLINSEECQHPVTLSQLKGTEIDDVEDSSTSFDSERWYWSLIACTVNRRVLIDAQTGEVSMPTHPYSCSDSSL